MNLNYINAEYQQLGNVCATASYGIIVEYFSNKKYSVNLFLNNYIKKFKVNLKDQPSISKQGQKKLREYRESQLSEHFHKECKENGDKRGFEFIVEFHNNNSFNTLEYCKIKKYKAQLIAIDRREILELRDELKSGSLAMVLYPIREGNLHSIVVGYDPKNQKYFKREPNDKEIKFEDFLSTNVLTEYILFE